MKNTELNISNMTISKASGYGRYTLKGLVNGQWLECTTINSEAFDYLIEQDWFTEEDYKKHEEAEQYCEMRLEGAYQYRMSNLEGIDLKNFTIQ